MDKRKHYTQMNQDEMAVVMNAVKSNTFAVTPYVLSRMNERRMNEVQIRAMLSYGKVIEVHNNAESEIRVLLRGKVSGKECCAVVSLTNKTLVTCYWNQVNDNHRTLDKTQYAWKVDLKTVV